MQPSEMLNIKVMNRHTGACQEFGDVDHHISIQVKSEAFDKFRELLNSMTSEIDKDHRTFAVIREDNSEKFTMIDKWAKS